MTVTAEPATKQPPQRPSREKSVEDIITAARTAPARSWAAWGACLVSSLLLWASFPPLDWSPLAFLAPMPLLMLARLERRPRWTYLAAYVGGFVLHLATLQWMRLGDPTMYTAWIALALYLAIYHPLFLLLCRTAVLRYRVPLVAAAPVFWTGIEFARATVMTGFAWYYLGHTQYRWLELIQIGDLTGAYGVSFLVMLAAACVAALVPVNLFERLRLVPRDVDASFAVRSPSRRGQWIGIGTTLALFAAALVYGSVRRGQATWTKPDAEPGPRIGLVQGNFVARAQGITESEVGEMRQTHYRLTGLAVRYQPDVIVWPEAMFPEPPLRDLSPDLSDEELAALAPIAPGTDERLAERQRAGWLTWWHSPDAKPILSDFAKQANAGLIIGITAYRADERGAAQFNSAAFVHPTLGYRARYDKLHRVPFGEYIPLRDELPFLHRFTPYGFGFGIEKGAGPVAFEYGDWRFAPLICFESSVPHLVTRFLRATAKDGKPVDVLVNMSNDGWFHGSSELQQHLITAAFRSVETRTPMVRAVNTGISAFIDGDGAILEPEVFVDADGEDRESMRDPRTGAYHRQLNAVLVHDVPLDRRTSLYVRYGDWFALTCCFGTLLCVMGWFVPRRQPVAK